MSPGKFAGLSDRRPLTVVPPVAESCNPAGARPSRVGKKVVSGHFSPELSRALNLLALEEDSSLQSLLGEAIDQLLRSRGRHAFGER